MFLKVGERSLGVFMANKYKSFITFGKAYRNLIFIIRIPASVQLPTVYLKTLKNEKRMKTLFVR